MNQDHDAEKQQMTIMVVTEPGTPTFQFGETIADIIEETKKAISSPEKEQDVTIMTNSLYLNGWANKHGYNATLVSDEKIIENVANNSISIIMLVPSAETIAHRNGEIALIPDDESILVAIQDELTRRDDDGQAVHPNVMITLMLPPEYRMVRANDDPDTYIRVIATAKLSN